MPFDAGVMVQYKYTYQNRHKYTFNLKNKHEINPIDGSIVLYFNIYSGLKLSAADKLERYYVCEPFVRSEKNEQFIEDGYSIYKEDIEVKILNYMNVK